MNRVRYLSAAALVLLSVNAASQSARPNGAVAGEIRWQELGNRTDSFDGVSLDTSKWINNPSDLVVGAWSFDANNAYVANGKLNIMATQETHTRTFQDSCWDGVAGGSSKAVQRQLYYKSGAVKSTNDGVYGYYEASIKGVKMFPGLAPAFWLYSDGHPYSDSGTPGSVDYSEIDIVELQQADWHGPRVNDADPINVSDHNLHARVFDQNGKIIWLRPKPDPTTQLLQFDAPHDPSAGFHTYAVENRADRIFWYVDGNLIGSKPNTYWHRPMHVIFSMGMRRQFIQYNANCQRADPNPSAVTSVGFPQDATMQVDYVKTWQVQPSVWLENPAQYTTGSKSGKLDVVVNYHGGSDSYVVLGNYNGLTLNLVEKNAAGVVGVVASTHDSSVADTDKRHGGSVSLSLDLTGVKSSNQLPAGHYYALAPVFRSSIGQDVYAINAIQPITISNANNPTPTPTPDNNTSNKLINSSFESSSLNPWKLKSGTGYVVNNNSHSGNALLVNGAALIEQEIAVEPLQTYNLSAWAKVAATGQNLVVGIKGLTNGQLSTQFKATSYQQKSLSFTTSAQDSSVTIYIYNGNTAHQGWVDDLVLTGGKTVNTPIFVTAVQLNPENLNLDAAQQAQLTALIQPSNATNKALIWTSANTNIATVTNTGLVTAHKAGQSTLITVTTEDGFYSDSTLISVNALATSTPTPTPISCDGSWQAVTSVALNPAQLTLSIGDSTTLNPVVLPSCASNKNVTYRSSDTAIAYADPSGVVHAKAKGSATITVNTKHLNKTASIEVKVE